MNARFSRKRIFAVMLAVVMLSMLALPSFASTGIEQPEQGASVTMSGTGSGYGAYRLLNLTTSLKLDHEAHEGRDHAYLCYNYAYTVNSAYRAELQNAVRTVLEDSSDKEYSDDELVEAIEKLKDDDIRTFADLMFEALKNRETDATAEAKVFKNIPHGYYLIVELGSIDVGDARSLVMLDTNGQDNITVTSKESVPTLVKKVHEVNDSNGYNDWQDAADADWGDTVEFRITVTLPEHINAYAQYAMKVFDFYDNKFSMDERYDMEVKLGDVELTQGSEWKYVTESGESGYGTPAYQPAGMSDKGTFAVVISDIIAAAKTHGVELSGASTLVITYGMKLNGVQNSTERYTVASNIAYLEYSADPYANDSMSRTVPDKVNVFTYHLTVYKVDGSVEKAESDIMPVDLLPDNGHDDWLALAGAQFELQKFDDATKTYRPYLDFNTANADLKLTEFRFNGLDSGKYKLIETVVPKGYAAIDPIEFEIRAIYEKTGDDVRLTGLDVYQGDGLASGDSAAFGVNLGSQTIEATIANMPGSRMPSTGGAGSVMLYAFGAFGAVCVIVISALYYRRRNGREA